MRRMLLDGKPFKFVVRFPHPRIVPFPVAPVPQFHCTLGIYPRGMFTIFSFEYPNAKTPSTFHFLGILSFFLVLTFQFSAIFTESIRQEPTPSDSAKMIIVESRY